MVSNKYYIAQIFLKPRSVGKKYCNKKALLFSFSKRFSIDCKIGSG